MQARRISAPLFALELFSNGQSDGCVRMRWTRMVCTVGKQETWKRARRSRNPQSHESHREEMRRERTHLQDAFDERRRPTRPMRTSLHVFLPVQSTVPIFTCAVEDPFPSISHSSAGFGAVPHLPSDVLVVSHDLPVRLAYPSWSKWKVAFRALVIFDVIT